VNAIVAGTKSDPTNGSLYYANLKKSTSGWFFRHIVNDPKNHPLRATVEHPNPTPERGWTIDII
jgi:spore germination cell wall hydrolase CwlJ-like protein